jgi:hypothetical protein
MTKKEIDAVLERVRTWPRERQEALARIALQLEARDSAMEPEDDETRAAVAEGLAQAKRRQFASERRVKAVWKKFGL